MDTNSNNYGSIKPVIEAIRENYASISDIKRNLGNVDLAEAAQMYLMDALGYTQLQAQEVTADLKKGLDNYNTQRKAQEENSEAIEIGIKERLSKYSDEERKDILTNILTVLQLGDVDNADKDVETIRSANASLTEEELIKAVTDTLDGLPFSSVADIVGNQIGNDTLALLDGLREMSSEEYKLAAAIQIYIIQQQGKLQLSDDDTKLPPEVIGAMTGASIDAINATNDLKNGHIDLKKWQRILKYILGALLVVTLCAISAAAILSVNLGFMYIITSIFGIGLLSSMLSIIVAFAFCVKACDWHDRSMDYALEKMSTIYDKAILKITVWADALRSKIMSYIGSSKANAMMEDKEKAHTDADAGNSVDNYNGTPALA